MVRGDRDWTALRRRFQQDRRLLVTEFLEDVAAERLHTALATEVPYDLAVRHDGADRKLIAPTDAEAATAIAQAAEEAADQRYGFAYESYMMVTAYLEGRDPQLPLHRLLEVLNSPNYLELMRFLTGKPVVKLDAQATRYRPGHFLRRHNDFHPSDGRLCAYVLNLTRGWQADWGGLLQFLDADGQVNGTFLPGYNQLAIFEVPQWHVVSLVAPWASAPRLSITGWMLDH
jgi:Rps23 Pro-64 3,4-dihydroxylase Tpa1-like proline 4-hydroxylase